MSDQRAASDTDLAWLAGFVDGEGHIKIVLTYTRDGIRFNRKNPHVGIIVANTDMSAMEKCKEIAGCGSIREDSRDNPKWKPVYTWEVYGDNARRLARKILPYSVVKLAKLKEVSEFENTGFVRAEESVRSKTYLRVEPYVAD